MGFSIAAAVASYPLAVSVALLTSSATLLPAHQVPPPQLKRSACGLLTNLTLRGLNNLALVVDMERRRWWAFMGMERYDYGSLPEGELVNPIDIIRNALERGS